MIELNWIATAFLSLMAGVGMGCIILVLYALFLVIRDALISSSASPEQRR